jgi:hypothetical protein
MADPVATDIEKVLDAVATGPLPEDLALGGGFAILGRGDMVDDRLDFGRVEYAVLAPGHQVVDGCRRGDFMAKDGIQANHIGVGRRSARQVGVENFFSDGFSHWISSRLVRIGFEHCQESRLGQHDFAHHFHALFALLLFLEQFAFAGDIAAVALGCDVLAEGIDC